MTADDQGDLFGGDSDGPGERPAGSPAGTPARVEKPLAARLRPRSLAEVVGQEHILRPGSLLPRLVAQNSFGSLLFYGPPGSGKTSIAEAIARETKSRFVRVNAV
ncbi:MAG: AAA family ATPase, partial [Opitutaceae bacterium]